MRTLLVHPSGLRYSEIFLRLEPLRAERVMGSVPYQLLPTPTASPKARTDLYIHTRPRDPAHTAPRAG
jgi:hypothetical protein